MNFVKYSCFVVDLPKIRVLFNLFLILFLSYLAGCCAPVRLPSAEQLTEFENAGPIKPTVDMDRLVKAKIGGGPYRVVPGDVLELTMPTILQVVTVEGPDTPEKAVPYVCRVSESGTVTLPVVGEIEAAGESLAQIESAVIDAFYPDYTVTRPPIFARVLEYNTAKVSVIGAVQEPGIYELRSDQMSLVALLMEAGGIVNEGAGLIKIIHSDMPAALPLYARSNEEIKVELAFEPLSPSSTKGELIVRFGRRNQPFKNFDIANPLHRRTVAKILSEKDSRFSTAKIELELLALAEELEAVSTAGSSEDKIVKTKVALGGKTGENRAERGSISDDVLSKLPHEGLDSNASIGQQPEHQRSNKSEPIVMPILGLNIPFADVALQEGDTVVVERLQLPMFTVVGLVNKPGNFSYPPDVRYNLMQALAFAGGFDRAAEPRYATVYRLKPGGSIVHATFEIMNVAKGSRFADTLNTLIKPGDIIAVEHTRGTRTRIFLDSVFRINFGVYAPFYLLGNNT